MKPIQPCYQILQMERTTKELENLRREINSLLKDFEKNRQWADFSHWLHRLLDTLGTRRCPFLPQQLTLAKRLAQCLNPSLPAGVHSTALKVYQNLLKNFGEKTELLPLMAMGLFPFFEHSNTQNKYTVLKLFEDYFIVDAEGVQMVVGLTNALLTVLNQTSQDQSKRVYAIFDRISKDFGRLWVDGAVWVSILKSPKVRLAGFKYFQKMFRDRDRAAQSERKMSEETEKIMLAAIEKNVEESRLGEEEKMLLTTIYSFKYHPDDNSTRFPNFSSLVVSSLSVCLEVGADNMIKRAALDLLMGYLKLESGVFGKKQGVILLQKMLMLLQLKEYSLTNRVYKYLFDHPNNEGFFHINPQKKKYELQILKEALRNLLVSNSKESESVLLIMEILIGDHPLLVEFLLEGLAIEIVGFAQKEQSKQKKQSSLPKTVADFYLNIVLQNRRIFLPAILKKIPNKEEIDPLAPTFLNILDTLRFYFSRMEKLAVEPRLKQIEDVNQQQKMDEAKERIEYLSIRVQTLRELIEELWSCKPYDEQQSLRILDLCNELLAEIHIICQSKEEGLSQEQIDKIETLLAQQAKMNRKTLYAKLLTLHPKPNKEMLLPYINDSSLSIVCINLLLGSEKVSTEVLKPRSMSAGKTRLRSSTVRSESVAQIYGQPLSLSSEEQEAVFFAIFKLLNCHLFQGRALEFIQRFRAWWGDLFVELINKVQPSEWLIYWKKMEGEVAGGILRMIENLNSQNSYHKHLSKKWIGEAENIITKVIDAIYQLLENMPERKRSIEQLQEGAILFKQLNIGEYERIFNLIQLVFKYTSIGFTKFFFLQKDKYLAPLVLFVFKCLESGQFTTRSRSLSLLSFILSQATEAKQKIDLLSLTMPNILAILDSIIDRKKTLGLNATDSQEELLMSSNFQIQLLEYVSLSIKRVGQISIEDERVEQQILGCFRGSNIYDVMLKGIIFTDSHYIKDLYIQSSKELSEMIAKVDRNKLEITGFITRILDKLFILLKNTDANRIESFIKSRNETSPKDSLIKRNISSHEELVDAITSFSKETVLETQIKENLNLEDKYVEIIELWNTVKFYLQFALRLQLKEIPIVNLLSLALSSFPLSYLKYTSVGSHQHANNLEILEEEIFNVTGLKKEVFEIFQILWNKENRQIIDFLVEKGDPRILVHCQLDPSKVLEAFNRSSKMMEVKIHLRPDRINLPKNILHYNFDNLIKENQLLFFFYLYLLYCNFRLLKNKRISAFFESLLETLHQLRRSSHVQTKIWLLEVMEVIGHRIVNTKELSIQNANRIRNELQHITKELIEDLQGVITRSKHFTHRLQMKTGLFNLFNKEEKENAVYDFVKNFPPTICIQFEHYKQTIKKNYDLTNRQKEKASSQFQKGNMEHPRERLSSYLMELDSLTEHQDNFIDNFLFGRFVNIPEEEFPVYLSYVALRTLIRIGNSILIALFDDLTRISMIVKEVLLNLLPLCENRENSRMQINELIAEYLHTVLANQILRPEVLRNLRRQILEVYMTNNFFKCTQKTLNHWRAIIDYTTGQNNDLLGDLLSKEGLFEGIFTKKAEATRQKIKSFERVCFIIYAGRVDRYENKLRVVLESLNEVMKQDDAPPALLILILFCIRILLMRLSAISLNKLFKSVWPSLITLLIQIFGRKKAGRNVNLQLAALKVVELIHAMELEQFMLHKWMFIFDYFGLKIDPMGEIEDNMPSCQMLSPFSCKPQLSNCFPNNRFRCKFVPETASQGRQGPVKRRLIVKKTYIDSEQDLQENALLLMQYMMDMNECRCEMSKGDIENLIEDQFISLDDYIFKIK